MYVALNRGDIPILIVVLNLSVMIFLQTPGLMKNGI